MTVKLIRINERQTSADSAKIEPWKTKQTPVSPLKANWLVRCRSQLCFAIGQFLAEPTAEEKTFAYLAGRHGSSIPSPSISVILALFMQAKGIVYF